MFIIKRFGLTQLNKAIQKNLGGFTCRRNNQRFTSIDDIPISLDFLLIGGNFWKKSSKKFWLETESISDLEGALLDENSN